MQLCVKFPELLSPAQTLKGPISQALQNSPYLEQSIERHTLMGENLADLQLRLKMAHPSALLSDFLMVKPENATIVVDQLIWWYEELWAEVRPLRSDLELDPTTHYLRARCLLERADNLPYRVHRIITFDLARYPAEGEQAPPDTNNLDILGEWVDNYPSIITFSWRWENGTWQPNLGEEESKPLPQATLDTTAYGTQSLTTVDGEISPIREPHFTLIVGGPDDNEALMKLVQYLAMEGRIALLPTLYDEEEGHPLTDQLVDVLSDLQQDKCLLATDMMVWDVGDSVDPQCYAAELETAKARGIPVHYYSQYLKEAPYYERYRQA